MTKLPEYWIEKILEQPETRMGVQEVDILFSDGHFEQHEIWWSEDINADIDVDDILDITVTHWKRKMQR